MALSPPLPAHSLPQHHQPSLILSIRTPSSSSSLWFLLPSPPSVPLPLPSPPIPTTCSSSVPLGPTLYLLGGSLNGIPSRSVQILHPRRRLWSLGPSMSSPREFPAAFSLSHRLFSIAGCLPSSPSWAESLINPSSSSNTNKWAPLSPSCPFHLRDKWMHGNAVLDGKLLAVADRGGVMFDPATESWSTVPQALDLGWKGRAAVVGGVLYTYDYSGKIKGYDWEREEWRQVEGLDKALPRFLCGAMLADLGGLLCLAWEGKVGRRNVVEISCAGIGISRTEEGGGLRGRVEWLQQAVLVVSRGLTIAHCVAVEL